MNTLAENDSFEIQHEYEQAFAVRKSDGKRIALGEHYGDPQGALILGAKPVFVVWGEGLTIRIGEGPVQELFRQGVAPRWEELAAASPPDPDYPDNPFPDELYPVEIESISEKEAGLFVVQARPSMRLASKWVVRVDKAGQIEVVGA